MDAIDKIHAFQRFGSILGLERMTELLRLLGNPQDDVKVIHVAGTNGKGSICRYLYSCLEAAGYKTGIYISPYLEMFNERIEVSGKYITDAQLADYTDRVLAQAEVMTKAGQQSPTEFEVITAIAFLFFKEQACDYVVLEVGLGGRGDSTNVCEKPLATVISSISYDHMDRLGNTLSEIAWEKAGIIKEGCPVITSAEAEDALKVIKETAQIHHAEYLETANLPYHITEEGLWGSRFDLSLFGKNYQNLEIAMAGAHQVKNAIAALATLSILRDRGDILITKEQIYAGFKAAKQPGRLEVLSMGQEQPMLVIDGAHNEDGAKALEDAVASFCAGKRILMVTGILVDKDVDGILAHFTAITKDFIVTEPDNPRKMAAVDLAAKIEMLGGKCRVAGSIQQACQMTKDLSSEYDVILFAGSLYMIGLVRTIIKEGQEVQE